MKLTVIQMSESGNSALVRTDELLECGINNSITGWVKVHKAFEKDDIIKVPEEFKLELSSNKSDDGAEFTRFNFISK